MDADASGSGSPGKTRRGFLGSAFMLTGLALSHLVALGFAARYLYPVRDDRKRRLFVALAREIPPGSAFAFRTPAGKTINIVHTSSGEFVALSDVCPHLGCRVHWDGRRGEFICPCHDGHFDASGAPLSGPPAEMNTPLPRYDVVLEGDRLFLEVPARS